MKASRAKAAGAVEALVLGGGINGLGVVRSLKAGGVCVTVAESNPRAPAMLSRHGRKALLPANNGPEMIKGLLALAQEHNWQGERRPVLFLTEEEAVRTVSEERAKLAPVLRITLPQATLLARLMHKDGFQRLAEAADAPIPRALHVRDGASIEPARTLQYPVVLKPGGRDAAYSARFRKAYHVRSYQELVALHDEIRPVLDDLIVQEWIEGGDADIYFCLQYRGWGGETVSFVGRKLRAWPPQVGGTASCVAAPQARGELERLTSAFFAHVGVTGMAGMEYKKDRRSGRFLMVEPTMGRTDYQQEVATLNGVNLALAGYRLELGQPVPTGRQPRRMVVWRDTPPDRASAEAQHQKPDFAGFRVVDALWRANDPYPAWVRLAGRVRNKTRHVAQRLRS